MTEEKNFFEKNMEMWDKWTSSYVDTMSKMMERAMEQSAVLKKQVDEAVATTVGAQMDATLTAIRSLEKQVELLSTKIDDFMGQGK